MKRGGVAIGLAIVSMFADAGTSSAAEPDAAAAAASIVQNRDEPGRNPYQAHVIFPSNCGAYDCAIHFPVIGASVRVVIEQVSCSFQTPSANKPFFVFLSGKASDPYLRTYLPVVDQGSFNGYDWYVANAQTLFYYVKGDQPAVDIYRSGGPASAPQGDCAISGYRVVLP